METVKIKLKGINRQTPYHEVEDGWLDEKINMRHDNGRLEPVGTKRKVYNLPFGTYNKIWVHEQDNIENYIGQDDSNDLRLINVLDGSSTLIKAYGDAGTVKVEFVKLFMIVIYDGGTDTFIWKDNAYSPIVMPGKAHVIVSTKNPKDLTTDEALGATALRGKYFEKVNEASKDNYHTGGIMVRAALRMYDGSYVMHSVPSYVNMGLQMIMYERQVEGGGEDNDPNKIKFTTSKLKGLVYNENFSTINADIFPSIVVFACKNQELYKIDEETLTDALILSRVKNIGQSGNYAVDFKEIYKDVGVNPDFKIMADSPAWYKIHEFSVKDMQTLGSTSIEEDFDLTGFYQDYATREVLTVDQFSHHTLSGAVSFNYNSRLVLAAIKTIFGSYAHFPFLKSVDTDKIVVPIGYGFNYAETLPVKLMVTLNTDSGERIKLIDSERPFFTQTGDPSNKKYLTVAKDVIGYPDARATKIDILVQKSGNWYNIGSYVLTKSLYGNFAYYHAPDFTVHPSEYFKNFHFIMLSTEFAGTQIVNIGEYSEVDFFDSNRVQVSETSNPLVFPAKNSYQVGTGKITDIAANTEPLSSGQFGEHPLEVFTSKGIWALIQGQGDVLFSNIIPVSGDVANDGSVVSIGAGVIYSTSKGIFLLQGKDKTLLTDVLTGLPNTDFQANANYLHYLNDIRLVQIVNKLSLVDILSYITDAKIGFDKIQEELIVTNSNYNYSYVFNFKSGFWYKLGESFRVLINKYPFLYCLREDGSANAGIISISEETYTGNSSVLLTTQPLKFGVSDSFKVVNRMILRCKCTQKEGTHAGFYFFGSSDLINWQRITGVNHLDGVKRDFLLTRSGNMNKYYIVVFAGQIDQLSYIDSLDVTFDPKLNRKLR